MGIAASLSGRNRATKWNNFMAWARPDATTRVLDVGFANQEFSAVDNWIEKHYPWPAQITALGVDGADRFNETYPDVRAVIYDGSTFPFGDGEFDIAWSNAVIEHVGGFDQQVLFVSELARVARRVWFTTPNRAFPVEVHTRLPFVHWMPAGLADRCYRIFGKGWAADGYMSLLYERDLHRVLDAAGVTDYVVGRNRLAGLTIDFYVTLSGSPITHRANR